MAAFLLCWPFAIPSLIAASRVELAWRLGDAFTARQASADAKKWGRIGVIVGSCLVGLSLLIVIIALSSIASLSRRY